MPERAARTPSVAPVPAAEGADASAAARRASGTCRVCGGSISVWDRVGGRGLCKSCRTNDRDRVEHARALFLGALTAVDLSTELTDRQRQIVAETVPESVGVAWHRKTGVAALRFLAEEALADEVMTADEDQRIREIGHLVRVDLDAALKDEADLADRVTLGRARDGRLPVAIAAPLSLRRREVCHLRVKADLLESVFSADASGREALWAPKGVPLSYNAYRGVRPKAPARAREIDSGILGVTDRRLIFRGNHHAIEVRYEDLIGFRVFQDGVGMRIPRSPADTLFKVRTPHFVAGLALAAAAIPRVRRSR